MLPTDHQNGVALVERGYNEPTRCLNFRVSFESYGDGVECAIKAVEAIGGYNGFAPERVVPVVLRMIELVSYPRISVGREGSPVIYVRCSEEESRAVIEAFEAVAADECDYHRGEVRAWWD